MNLGMKNMMKLGGAVMALLAATSEANNCADRTGGDKFWEDCDARRHQVFAVGGLNIDNFWCAWKACRGPHENVEARQSCVVLTQSEIDSCIGTFDADLSTATPIHLRDGTEVQYIGEDNVDYMLDRQRSIENWKRYMYMVPDVGQAAACQAWMQLRPDEGGLKLISDEVKTFAFDADRRRCYFFKEFPAKGSVPVRYGPRYCDCDKSTTPVEPPTVVGGGGDKTTIPVEPPLPAVGEGDISELHPHFALMKSLRGQASWVDEKGSHAVQWKDEGLPGSAVQFVDGDKLVQISTWE